jgi:hypothetical protein
MKDNAKPKPRLLFIRRKATADPTPRPGRLDDNDQRAEPRVNGAISPDSKDYPTVERHSQAFLDAERELQLLYAARGGAPAPRSSLEMNYRAAIALLEEMQPRDALEARIIARFVAADDLHREFLLKAAAALGRSEWEVDRYLSHAQKAGKLAKDLLATLDSHRGKAHQKVVVEHVHVEPADARAGRDDKSPTRPPPPRQFNPAVWGDDGEIAPIARSHQTVDPGDDHERRRHPTM